MGTAAGVHGAIAVAWTRDHRRDLDCACTQVQRRRARRLRGWTAR